MGTLKKVNSKMLKTLNIQYGPTYVAKTFAYSKKEYTYNDFIKAINSQMPGYKKSMFDGFVYQHHISYATPDWVGNRLREHARNFNTTSENMSFITYTEVGEDADHWYLLLQLNIIDELAPYVVQAYNRQDQMEAYIHRVYDIVRARRNRYKNTPYYKYVDTRDIGLCPEDLRVAYQSYREGLPVSQTVSRIMINYSWFDDGIIYIGQGVIYQVIHGRLHRITANELFRLTGRINVRCNKNYSKTFYYQPGDTIEKLGYTEGDVLMSVQGRTLLMFTRLKELHRLNLNDPKFWWLCRYTLPFMKRHINKMHEGMTAREFAALVEEAYKDKEARDKAKVVK